MFTHQCLYTRVLCTSSDVMHWSCFFRCEVAWVISGVRDDIQVLESLLSQDLSYIDYYMYLVNTRM